MFDDAVDSLTADVREMLRREADDPRWHPTHFELSFGLSERAGKRDAESVDAPAALDIGLRLRGSIDLVEESSEGTLRATDYKTGKVRAKEGQTVVGGGLTLQPVLYAMALEKLFPGRVVEGGRLYYSTAAAGFYPVWVPLDEGARESAKAVVDTVAKAMKNSFSGRTGQGRVHLLRLPARVRSLRRAARSEDQTRRTAPSGSRPCGGADEPEE